MRLLLFALAIALSRVGHVAGDDAARCPWKFVTGHWRLTDSTGFTADVVWRPAGDDSAVIGEWQSKDGQRGAEVVGWRRDDKSLVSVGCGSNGLYWQITSTTVTATMLKGDIVRRTSDGKVLKGTWQLTEKSDNEMATLFVGTQDGKEVTITGNVLRRYVTRRPTSTD